MKKAFIHFCLAAVITAAAAMVSSCSGNGGKEAGTEDNAVIEAIMNRRSIRKYQDREVPRDLLEKIAWCGIHAPNAMNAQRWEVRIVDSPEFMKLDPSLRNKFRNAAAIICVAGEDARFVDIDCGLMGENMMLAAHSLGLGTCCLAGPVDFLTRNAEARPFYDALQLPEGYSLKFVLAVGWPDEEPEARPRDAGKIRFVEFN